MFMPWELPDILDGEVVRQGWAELQTLARLNRSIENIGSSYLKVSGLEMSWYMRNQLLRDTDWAGMSHSLEIRVPLVDVNLATTLSPLFANFEGRPGKLEMARTPANPLPAEVLGRRKTGFTVPVRRWLLERARRTSGQDLSVTDGGLRSWCKEVYNQFGQSSMLKQPVRSRLPAWLSSSNSRFPTKENESGSHILVLLSDAFGGFGGIAKFNRDLLSGLSSCPWINQVTAIPRLMDQDMGELPRKLRYATEAVGGKLHYLKAVGEVVRHVKREGKLQTAMIICAHINLLPAAFLAKKLLDVPIVLIVHGIDAWKPTKSRLVNRLAMNVDYLISVSELTRDRFLRWSGVDAARTFILPDCVELSDFTPGAKPTKLLDRYGLHGKKVLLTVGRLASAERYKGFDEILEVLPEIARSVPEIVYLVVGDGADRARLERKALALGIKERVIFTGRISDAEKQAHYRLADAYVMPSSGEGFGIVLLEALACGLPVIASKIDGGREALRDGELGTLVNPLSRAEIIAAILNALRQPVGSVRPGLEHFSSENFQKRCREVLIDLNQRRNVRNLHHPAVDRA
jgi:phosphatidylinositol alpha-1,6-mannosyltransferase